MLAVPRLRADDRRQVPNEQLYGVHVTDHGGTAFAVGAFGSVFRSGDGGMTWEGLRTGVVDPLFDVTFVDARRGIVVGKSGTTIRTTDGGTTWATGKSGTAKHLFGVAMIDGKRGWAVGDWGVILATEDGGATWTDHSLEEDVVLSAVTFVDPQHGWIVGEFGTVLATTDGGATWQRQNPGTEKTLFGVAFNSPQAGWAVGIDGLVLRTRDAGATWVVQRGAAAADSLEELAFQDLLTNPGLYDVALGGSTGCIVGDTGTVLVTTDRGETWEKRELPVDVRLYWLRGASVNAEGAGLMVGAKGLVVPLVGGDLRPPTVGSRIAARDGG
jgi:photosystem II stability/assembly factor-like uncharacterized protein